MIDTKALREKVLDLAIRGKLVPQDPNDEPASVLLERIRVQKEQMVKEGKLKAKDIKNDTIIFKGEDNLHYEKFHDGTVKCIEDEIPFEVPEGWEWSRLGFIGNWQSGATPSRTHPEYYNGKIPWLKTGDLNDGYISEVSEYISEYGMKNSSVCLNPVGSVLIAMYGATIGKLGIANIELTTNQACCACLPIHIKSQFLFYFLMYQKEYFIKQAVGGAQPNISKEKIVSTLFPVPPINEQAKIVIKIKELMELVNNIDFDKNSLSEIISSTKSKILDLAIRGKLVPQDPNDEPASVLLERIRAEKEELIKQGKIKRDKKESFIFRGDDNSYYRLTSDNKCYNVDVPFEVPDNWTWCNLSMIGTTNIGLTYKPCEIVADGTMVLRSSNIINGKIDLTDLVRVNSTIRETQYIEENDILICARNGSKALVGKCAIFKGVSEKSSFGAFMAIYRSKFFEYIYYFLNSEIFRSTFNDDDTKQINQLTQDMIKNTVIPLPPFAEQKRIAEAIETAFAYLDEISNSIS